MNNYAEYFAILYYENGELIRVDSNKPIVLKQYYNILPLLNTNPEPDCYIDYVYNTTVIEIFDDMYSPDLAVLPNSCFLVQARHGFPYTLEEVESINKIWNNLIKQIKWKLI